jgi:hypothetical protein
LLNDPVQAGVHVAALKVPDPRVSKVMADDGSVSAVRAPIAMETIPARLLILVFI